MGKVGATKDRWTEKAGPESLKNQRKRQKSEAQ